MGVHLLSSGGICFVFTCHVIIILFFSCNLGLCQLQPDLVETKSVRSWKRKFFVWGDRVARGCWGRDASRLASVFKASSSHLSFLFFSSLVESIQITLIQLKVETRSARLRFLSTDFCVSIDCFYHSELDTRIFWIQVHSLVLPLGLTLFTILLKYQGLSPFNTQHRSMLCSTLLVHNSSPCPPPAHSNQDQAT